MRSGMGGPVLRAGRSEAELQVRRRSIVAGLRQRVEAMTIPGFVLVVLAVVIVLGLVALAAIFILIALVAFGPHG
jgi:hypothetical protein